MKINKSELKYIVHSLKDELAELRVKIKKNKKKIGSNYFELQTKHMGLHNRIKLLEGEPVHRIDGTIEVSGDPIGMMNRLGRCETRLECLETRAYDGGVCPDDFAELSKRVQAIEGRLDQQEVYPTTDEAAELPAAICNEVLAPQTIRIGKHHYVQIKEDRDIELTRDQFETWIALTKTSPALVAADFVVKLNALYTQGREIHIRIPADQSRIDEIDKQKEKK